MSEREVTIGGGVRGSWAEAAAPAPVVVMLHGFGGHRDEVGGLFAKLATQLARRDIGSLRIDFPGCGKSEGEFGDITGALYRRAAIDALRFAKSAPGADPKRLGLLGYSFGGAVATMCLGGDAPHARALALWAPVGDPKVDMVESLGAARAAEAERRGVATVPWGKGEIRLKRAFFRGLAEMKPLDAVRAYDGGFFVATGGRDRLAKYVGEFYAAAARAKPCEQRTIEDADHFFVGSDKKSLAKPLLDDTAAFFAATLRG
jgi:alpha/beta superfamily hydrolase